MHELGITRGIIRMVLEECRKNGIKKPVKIIAELGEFSPYKKEPILFYFDLLKKDEKRLSSATLEIKEMPGKIICKKCKKKRSMRDPYLMSCPSCDSSEIEIISGKSFAIKAIEAEV